MNDTKFRWGIIGPGNIARQFASCLPHADSSELVAVASRSKEKAEAFGAEFGAERTYGSYEQLANDPEIDAIYVATPHSEHFAGAAMAIQSGKAVLVEKPFTLNTNQAREIAGLARKKHVFCMEAMWTRFFPIMGRLRELVGEAAIGGIKMVYADFGFSSNVNPEGRLYDTRLGGGALLDVGIYPISFACMMLGKPAAVTGLADIGVTGVDEVSGMLMRFNGGELAVLSTAIRANTPQQAIVIGEEGSIHVNPQWWRPTSIILKRNGQPDELIEMPHPGAGFQFEANEVRRCVHAGKTESAILPLDDTIMMMEIMDNLRAQWGVKYASE
jgi:dihydrodiol dehydrogenase / D-xylose 1-dehydrogenase (NADP)